MARKSKKAAKSSLGREWGSIIAGPFLLFLAALVFLGDSTSSVGSLVAEALDYLMGDSYKYIFSPIIAALAVMIIFKRTIWNSVRFSGLLMFWVSICSLLETITPLEKHGLFDLSGFLIGLFGRIPAILLLAAGFFGSLYLTLHISYRRVLSSIHERLPSVATVKDVVKEFKKEE